MDESGVNTDITRRYARAKNGERAHVLFLPPYSPDLNPIEQMWSKIKAFLRKVKARSQDILLDALPDAFASISVQNFIGWFYHDGYSCL
jgi:transposase